MRSPTAQEDSATWETAYAWVLAEGDDPDRPGIASDIPADELIAMAETVRNTPQSERYALMTIPASNGKVWFDVIEGFSASFPRQAIADTISNGVQQNQLEFSHILDLGSGTGNSLRGLEHCADKVIGVDRNPALLDIAKRRVGPNTSLVQADVTALPFADESFDLATSLGIEGALDKQSQIAFYTELARVLMPGGTYITAFLNYPRFPSTEMAEITETSKGVLADMICDTVSGGVSITERLDDDETTALLTRLGLRKDYYLHASQDEQDQAILQVVIKDAS